MYSGNHGAQQRAASVPLAVAAYLKRARARPWRKIVWGIGIICVVSLLVISCTTVERAMVAPPEIPGATFVGNATCSDCHSNYTRIFAAAAHAKLYVESSRMAGSSGCESCHGAGSKHVAAGGGRGKFIINPGRDPQACFTCHLEIHAEFNLPQHHPVREGKMNCVQCHDPHGFDIMKSARGGLAMSRLNEQCAACHREQSRRFVFEHEALREGCTACHQPHGSVNRKLLAQPDPNLCLRCHAQTQRGGHLFIGDDDHTDKVRRATCWTSTCHTAVHGSNIDRVLRY